MGVATPSLRRLLIRALPHAVTAAVAGLGSTLAWAVYADRLGTYLAGGLTAASLYAAEGTVRQIRRWMR